MIIYNAIDKQSAILRMEQFADGQGNQTFLTLNTHISPDAIVDLLGASPIGERVVAVSRNNGRCFLVMQGAAEPKVILDALAARGMRFSVGYPPQPVDWWSIRGALGVVGQALQLTSAFTQVERKDGAWVRKGFSPDIGVFAILNLIANFGNIIYGEQKEPDTHRLEYAKQLVQRQIAPQQLGSVAAHEPSRIESQGVWQRFNAFAHRHSVRFFELGLRFVGALALLGSWKKSAMSKGWELLKQGEVGGAVRAVRNPSRGMVYAGMAFIVGKIIAWFSKVPDPYDPTPHSTLDKIREKYLFPVGGLIEATAGMAITQNALTHKRIRRNGAEPYRDWFGAVGGGMFTAAYLSRLGAQFGRKTTDIGEVTAYAATLLRDAPPERVCQLAADAAAALVDHFADKKVCFGDLYRHILEDLKTLQMSPDLAQKIVPKPFVDRLATHRSEAAATRAA